MRPAHGGRPSAARLVVGLAALAVVLATVVGLVAVPLRQMHGETHPVPVPLADSPAAHGLAFETIEFPSRLDGLTLRGWYLPSPRPTGTTVVIAPGVSANREAAGVTLRIAPDLLREGYDVLAFDFRAEGESDGDTLSFGAREHEDLLGAVAEARRRGASSVAVLGFSMGGVSAILAAAVSDDIDAVIADSAFADLPATLSSRMRSAFDVPDVVVPYGLALYRLTSGTDPDGVRPVEAIGAVTQPVLLVAGTRDSLVPATDSLAIAAAAGGPASTWVLEGVEHVGAFHASPDAYTRRVIEFLRDALAGGGAG